MHEILVYMWCCPLIDKCPLANNLASLQQTRKVLPTKDIIFLIQGPCLSRVQKRPTIMN